MKAGYHLTSDPSEIDHEVVWRGLHDDSCWVAGRPWDVPGTRIERLGSGAG